MGIRNKYWVISLILPITISGCTTFHLAKIKNIQMKIAKIRYLILILKYSDSININFLFLFLYFLMRYYDL